MLARRHMLFVLGAAAFFGGCIESDLKTCDDGTLCAGVCVAGAGCVQQTQITACLGLDEGDACVLPGIGGGTCKQSTCIVESCGNGIVEGNEICDDGNQLAGDGCNGTCSSDERCGNGVTELAEECDCGDGSVPIPLACGGMPNGTLACRDDCGAPRCGDGVMDPGEACDDANRIDGDGCSRDCLSNETCGNGVRDPGEGCDDGNLVSSDGCQFNCELEQCGDAIVDLAEECDDGALISTDACTPECLHAVCGDGFLWLDHETCDDGNLIDTDGCPSTCEPAFCGDTFVRTGVEECDDGNTDDTDACRNGCIAARCGDGVVRVGVEACDDGNAIDDGNGCSTTCTRIGSCGDGIVQSYFEECDDTSASCVSCQRVGSCGDGVIDVGAETCDDGNTANNDGCSSSCFLQCQNVSGVVWASSSSSVCYLYFVTPFRTWQAAENHCQQLGGHLASSNSSTENTSTASLVTSNSPIAEVWIGLNDIASESTFVWSDTASLTYTNWINGSPDMAGNSTANDCVSMVPGGLWAVSACTNSRLYICEIHIQPIMPPI